MVEIAVTGIGLVTPGGIGTEASWQAVCSATATAGHAERLAGLPVDLACEVAGFSPSEHVGRRSALTHDRFVQLGITAAREAVADSGLDPDSWDGGRVGIVMGCGLGGVSTWERQHSRLLDSGPQSVSALLIPMLVPNMVAGHLAMDLRAHGPNLVTATACASGATAIGTAMQLLQSGQCDVAVAGGSEAGISPLIATGFNQMGALSRRLDDPASASRPFDADRDGFVLAEGSGVLVLERLPDARARAATVRAVLAGYGASADAYHMTAPDPDGRGAIAAMASALDQAGLAPSEIGHVNAHGTSTKLNDLAEARAVGKLFGRGVALTSTKGVTGHALGAAGAIEAAFTVLTVERSIIPPTANLVSQDPDIDADIVTRTPRTGPIEAAISNSFGFGGHNVALVVRTA